jgi:dTDP-4-amino-4,6-dideoxygalactose transaminase
MIPFNSPAITGGETAYLAEVFRTRKFCGDNAFTGKCSSLLERMTGSEKVLLTTSCTHALELAALLCDIQPGDEVIMPSFTFVSTANAFALRGATIVFVDIRPDTMNLNEGLIKQAITPKTKAIVPVHYAGVGCEMGAILQLAGKYNLHVIEDAAQGIMSYHESKPLGTFGQLAGLSFHETKNCHCGEGGALLINDPTFVERAEIIREKGTNRGKFLKGRVDKYTWVDIGSSYLPSELNAAFLLAQLEHIEEITSRRVAQWNKYYELLEPLKHRGQVELPYIPPHCKHNAHTFFIKLNDQNQRRQLIAFLKTYEIATMFHYVPLHSSMAGMKYGRFSGQDVFTTRESERLLRLPMFHDLQLSDVEYVCKRVRQFYDAG